MPVCQRCGYKWKYDESLNKFAYCYSCNKILSKERKRKEMVKLKKLLEELNKNPQKYDDFMKEFSAKFVKDDD